MIRCKFRVESIEENYSPGSKKVALVTQYDQSLPEDGRFTRWTPSGRMEVVIDNPAAIAQLKVGGYVYVDLTPIEAKE